ncbi:MAG: putative porin [Bacteroidales bacterium]|nr:putative porin [Bacteroidales bacterium]
MCINIQALARLKLIIIIFCFSGSILFSNNKDTLLVTDSSAVFYYYNNIDVAGFHKLYNLDTSLTGIQNYDPLFSDNKYYASLGNIGLAHKNLVFSPFITQGFNFGTNSFDNYLFKNDKIKYYRVVKAFTDLFYVMGAKKEQFLRVIHSQNVTRRLTLGINFRLIHSPGFYKRQFSDDKNFVCKVQYSTKNKRYSLIANYIHNKISVQENGGITFDSIFEKNIENNRELFDINLSNAENRLKQNSFFVNQYFRLSKNNLHYTDSMDTKDNDSFDLGQISYSLYFSKLSQIYKDDIADTLFYWTTYDKSNPTYDSTFIYKIENQLFWHNSDDNREKKYLFFIGLKHRYVEISGYADKKYFNQFIPSINSLIKIIKNFELILKAKYVSGDYNEGDYELNAQINLKKGKSKFIFKGTYTKQEPEWFYQQYYSNHFRWDNNFNKQKIISGGLAYKYKKFETGVNYYKINDFVYLDTLAYPCRFNKELNLLSAHIYKDFKLGYWGFDNKLIYQSTTEDNVLRLPELIANISIHYTRNLFKSAATLQLGFDFFYNSNYFADAYMPATRSFYLQNKKEIGNYFYGDLFLILKIKRARLFLKYHHINSGLTSYDYYMVPHYPMQDGGFRFGVSWRFYD